MQREQGNGHNHGKDALVICLMATMVTATIQAISGLSDNPMALTPPNFSCIQFVRNSVRNDDSADTDVDVDMDVDVDGDADADDERLTATEAAAEQKNRQTDELIYQQQATSVVANKSP